LLHGCGATINEMNAVRKHLSRIKGGRLAQAFHGKHLLSLIISDVAGDPLDVIASGPTAADPTSSADPPMLLERPGLTRRLASGHGLGGRNQQFVLALALLLGGEPLDGRVIFSAGTDGEDGPTDAAGAFADATTLRRAAELGLDPQAFLQRNDAFHFFEATGDLFKPGLTQSNVMDIRVILVGGALRGPAHED